MGDVREGEGDGDGEGEGGEVNQRFIHIYICIYICIYTSVRGCKSMYMIYIDFIRIQTDTYIHMYVLSFSSWLQETVCT